MCFAKLGLQEAQAAYAIIAVVSRPTLPPDFLSFEAESDSKDLSKAGQWRASFTEGWQMTSQFLLILEGAKSRDINGLRLDAV